MTRSEETAFRGRITGNFLKAAAILSMFLDHIGAALLEGFWRFASLGRSGASFLQTGQGRLFQQADFLLRGIGRLAFPIFCFLLIEGYIHTKNVRRYAVRLAVFALVSEIPFNLAFYNHFMAPEAQNVFFTLLIGLLTVEGMKRFRSVLPGRIGAALVGCLLADFLRTDYASAGVLLIVLFYLAKTARAPLLIVGIFLILLSLPFLGAACLALIPISLYNGQRGRGGWKYAFYLFYPVHLMILFLFRVFIMGIPMPGF